MPFVTEEIWQKLSNHINWQKADLLMSSPWPKVDEDMIDDSSEEKTLVIMDVIRAVRNIRSEKGVDPHRKVEAYIFADIPKSVMDNVRPVIETLARIDQLHLVEKAIDIPTDNVATSVINKAQVALPLMGLFDISEERNRLNKQLEEVENLMINSKRKLENTEFCQKAPQSVVQKEEERLSGLQERMKAIEEQLNELSG